MNNEANPRGLIKVKPAVGGATTNPVMVGFVNNIFNARIAEIAFAITNGVFIYW